MQSSKGSPAQGARHQFQAAHQSVVTSQASASIAGRRGGPRGCAAGIGTVRKKKACKTKRPMDPQTPKKCMDGAGGGAQRSVDSRQTAHGSMKYAGAEPSPMKLAGSVASALTQRAPLAAQISTQAPGAAHASVRETTGAAVTRAITARASQAISRCARTSSMGFQERQIGISASWRPFRRLAWGQRSMGAQVP